MPGLSRMYSCPLINPDSFALKSEYCLDQSPPSRGHKTISSRSETVEEEPQEQTDDSCVKNPGEDLSKLTESDTVHGKELVKDRLEEDDPSNEDVFLPDGGEQKSTNQHPESYDPPQSSHSPDHESDA